MSYYKLPSSLNNTHTAVESITHYGFLNDAVKDRITWMKLMLDPSQTIRLEGLKEILQVYKGYIPPDKTVVDVVTDYLTFFHDHLKSEFSNGMLERNGIRGGIGENFYDGIKKKIHSHCSCCKSLNILLANGND